VIVALDFDGVLHDPYDREPGRRMGRPLEGALEACRKMADAGHQLVVFTVRAKDQQSTEHVTAWLRHFGFPPMAVAITKPAADVYIDNRAIRFTTWSEFWQSLHGPAV
jgi:hypothetical protein